VDLNEAGADILGWQWHQLDHMQRICTFLQTHNHTNTSSLNFYRPDALPDDQLTVSKHIVGYWLFICRVLNVQSTPGSIGKICKEREEC